jgi:cell division initiation protein
MKVTPVDIQQIGFRRAFRGYDRQEVDAFLTGLSETFEEMNKENREAKERIAVLETSLEELKRKEDLLNQTLVSAERMVDDMKRQAQREAELRVREAEVAADNLTRRAREERTAIEQDVITWRRRQVELVEQFRGFLRGIEKSLDLAVDPARHEEEATAGPRRGSPS